MISDYFQLSNSGTVVSDEMSYKLNTNLSIRFLAISFQKIKQIFKATDIVLYAKSFKNEVIKNRKYSSSLIIIDCIQNSNFITGVGLE